MQCQTLIIDGPYLAHRSYGAPYKLTTTTGLDATMIHSFMRTLKSLYKQFKPKEIIIAWESHGTKSWRREMLPTYKPSSGKVTQEYIDELRDLQVLLHLLNIKQYYSPNNEADDVIGRLTTNKKENILVYTVDKDIMQVVNQFVHVWTGKEFVMEETVVAKFGVKPKQIPEYLAIVGDTSDNIKGLHMVGPKKALKFMNGEISINVEQLKKIQFNVRLTSLNCNCKLESIPNKNFKTDETLSSIMDKYELRKMKENIKEYKLLGE